MNCKFCGAEVEEGAKFCPNCGKNLEEASEKKKCPQCGAELEKDAKFCLKCGCSLEKKAAPKGNKKLIIGIIVLAVVVCVGAGIGLVAHKKAVEKAAYEQRLAEERAAEEARKELIKTYEQKAIELMMRSMGLRTISICSVQCMILPQILIQDCWDLIFLPSMCKDYALLKSLLKKSGKEI